MERYTRYYVKSVVAVGLVLFTGLVLGSEGNGIGSFFRGLFRFVKPLLYSRRKAVGKEVLKTGSNIITNELNKEPEQPVRSMFKNRFIEAKDNLEQKIKKMARSGLSLKKHKPKKAQSMSKRRKVKDIFTEKQ
jgi:hypothetical protein